MNKNLEEKNKKILLKTIGKIVKEKRLKQNKGIILFGYEYDISTSSIAKLETGERDVQITTLWKIINALGMDTKKFIEEVENNLPKGFKLIDN